MSESRQRKTRTQIFLSSYPYCIFCGGLTPATTIDHVPPKITFREKQWPESFEFPACATCNNGSKKHDQLFGFMARMGDKKVHTALEQEEVGKLIKAIIRNHPVMAREMTDISLRKKRTLSRLMGIKPQVGETYHDLPLLHVPDLVHEAISAVGAKLTKALYFKHTGKILPINVGIRFRWFTNAQQMMGSSPLVPELLEMAKFTGEVIRNNNPLKDQFDYRYVISSDHQIGMFCCVFGETFGFVSFLTVDPNVIEAIVAQAMEDSDSPVDKFIKVAWPI